MLALRIDKIDLQMKEYLKKSLDDYNIKDLPSSDWARFCDEIAYNLGWFIIAFNSLEETITDSIIELTDRNKRFDEEITYIMIGDKSFSQKTNILEKLLFLHFDGDKEGPLFNDVSELFRKIRELGEIRNNYVHADWYQTSVENEKISIRVKTKAEKKGIFHVYLKTTPKDIQTYESEIEAIEDELNKVIEKFSKVIINEKNPIAGVFKT